MMNHKKLIATSVALALSALSPSAFAVWPVSIDYYVPTAITQLTQMYNMTVTTPIVQAIDALKSSIVGANAEIGSQAETRQLDAWKLQKILEAKNLQQPGIDACGAQSTAAYAQSVHNIANATASGMKAGGAAKAGNAPTAPTQDVLTEDMHHRFYCDVDTDPNKCADTSPPVENNAGEAMAGADARSETLFRGAGAKGRAGNLTFDKTQQDAAAQYIGNVIDSGDSPRKLSPAEYATPDGSGKRYEGLRVAYEARVSMSRDVLEEIASQRVPVAASRAMMKAVIAGAPVGGASYISNRLTAAQQWGLGDVSPMEMMDIEVGRRVDNPDWYAAINTNASNMSMMREQTFMMALMMKMQYQQMRRNEVVVTLAAVQAAELAKTNMKPKVAAAENAVMNSTSKK